MKYHLSIYLLVSCIFGYGQEMDTLISIPTVDIQGERLKDFGQGVKIQTIDSATIAQFSTTNLSDLIQQESGIFLRTYGLGSLSTPSFRGTGAGHTAILWNGINLQSSMNGVLDFALVPIVAISSVDIQHGGGSALFGSGAIGGVVHLNTALALRPTQQVQIQTQLGSFGQWQQHGSFKYSTPKWATQTSVYYHQANNDFPFINIAKAEQPQENQANNDLLNYGITQHNRFRLADGSILNFNGWYQNTMRQIPPTMTQGESIAFQEDEFYRMVLDWKKVTENAVWLARSAYLDETIFFDDAAIGLQANNHAKSWINEVEAKVYLADNQLLNIGANYTHYQAETDNYAAILHQNRIALFAAYRLQWHKWQATASLREEWIDGDFVPFTFAIGVEGQLSNQLKLLVNASNNYKTPTFNDLYWVPGGNPNLTPETSWNQDIGLQWSSASTNFPTTLQFNVFNSWVDDWILWSPMDNGIWSPDNVKKVWARGVEVSGNITKQFGQSNWTLGGNYSFTQSTNQAVYNNQTFTVDKQLIYTPLHRGNILLEGQYKKFQVGYVQLFEGERFTTRDNNNNLPHYTIGHLTLRYGWTLKKVGIQTQLKIHNIWNTNYQAIAWRPMPLRYYSLSMQVEWK